MVKFISWWVGISLFLEKDCFWNEGSVCVSIFYIIFVMFFVLFYIFVGGNEVFIFKEIEKISLYV